jgi:hypothetical protein
VTNMGSRPIIELLPENEREPNRLAKKAIKSLREQPDPTDLYWLQLVRLCLDTGVLRLAHGLKEAPFLSLLDMLDRVISAQAQEFLEGPEIEEEGPKVVVAPDPDWEPAELAAMIIDVLDSRAGAELPDYPTAMERI